MKAKRKVSTSSVVVCIAFFIGSCTLFKPTTSTTKNPANIITLDTVNVSANSDTTKSFPYQASVTRITDIIHTKLEIKPDWSKQYLYGNATITLKPYYYPTQTIALDARGMELKEVALIQKNDTKKIVQYKYENNSITIELDKEYSRKDTFKLFIDYIAKPNELKTGGSAAIKSDKGLYFINPEGKEDGKPQQIWTQGETQSNSVWFPTNDRPNEKMTEEIYITVDKKYTTLSNGELVFQKENTDGTRTDYWHMDMPHAPYLVMFAVGEFFITKDKWRGKEVNYYLEKDYTEYAKSIFGNTPEMIEFFSTKLGIEFPWNKYSQIVVRDYVSGAMENTTATLHGEFIQITDREKIDGDYEDVISHELFHQWFGDYVTCESWSNVPLNESFATYGEYLWKEYKYSRAEADMHLHDDLEKYLTEASRNPKTLIRYNYKDREEMFDAHSYQKGGLILHMLRKYVGDDAFFESLNLYLETNKFDNVEIHNLRLAFEKITGEDLNWFFNQWFLSSGHPDLLITHNYNEIVKKYQVTIEQTQDLQKSPLFKLPMDVDIYLNGKKERRRITVTQQKENFEFEMASRPELVNVDAEKNILCTKREFGKPLKDCIYQMNHCTLYKDKYEALIEFVRNESDSLAEDALYNSLNDSFWYVRYITMPVMDILMKNKAEKIKNKMMSMARTDEKSLVRAEAITFLADTAHFKDQKQFINLYKEALNEKSYAVLTEALYGLSKVDSTAAVTEAMKLENEKNKNLKATIMNIYALHGTDKNNDFFLKASDEFTGVWRISFYSLYGSYLMRCNDEVINKALPIFEKDAANENVEKFAKFFAKRTLQDLAGKYEIQEQSEKDSAKLVQIKNTKKRIEDVLEKFNAEPKQE